MKKFSVIGFMVSLLAGVISVYGACPRADITGDCKVNLEDFAIMASEWLTWGHPEAPDGMVWIPISDSGAGMKDFWGEPIIHGGFTGEMSKYETTNAQYCEFLNAALASNDITIGADNIVYGANGTNRGEDFIDQIYFTTYAAGSGSQITYSHGIFSVHSDSGYHKSNHPVIHVSWYGAAAFCNYYGYRLPTEWQWQAVADYDGSYFYGCGLYIEEGMANYYSGIVPGAYSLTVPVGCYGSYGYGIDDMAGNVWEWTNSVYGDSSNRIIRGGSWYSQPAYCSVAYRAYREPSQGGTEIGFRVCRDLVEPTGMVWVRIKDPGVDGHEPFNGEMSKYETTNAQYCEFLNAALASHDIIVGADNIVYGQNGANAGEDFIDKIYFKTYAADPGSQITYSNGTFSVRSRDGYNMSNHPVVHVSWYGATAFCNYYTYKLPTEWQWQAAADYDGSYEFGCGIKISQSRANFYSYNPLNLSKYPYTSPVDYYVSYGYGINDMAGNVLEWTSTVYIDDDTIRIEKNVVRGGSWYGVDDDCTVSYSDYYRPKETYDDLGFRVCR